MGNCCYVEFRVIVKWTDILIDTIPLYISKSIFIRLFMFEIHPVFDFEIYYNSLHVAHINATQT